jgi:hypothetical protein
MIEERNNHATDEPARAVKERAISFRVSEEEYERIEMQARRSGETPNGWSRKLVVAECLKGRGMTANERILLEEIGVIRHLFGRWLRRELPPEEYEKLRQEAEQHTAIGEMLLEKRAAARAS